MIFDEWLFKQLNTMLVRRDKSDASIKAVWEAWPSTNRARGFLTDSTSLIKTSLRHVKNTSPVIHPLGVVSNLALGKSSRGLKVVNFLYGKIITGGRNLPLALDAAPLQMGLTPLHPLSLQCVAWLRLPMQA